MSDYSVDPGATIERLIAEREALQVLLTAADERADVLEGLLWECQGLAMFTLSNGLRDRISAALKPAEEKPE